MATRGINRADDRDGRQHHAFPVDSAVIVRAATDSAD